MLDCHVTICNWWNSAVLLSNNLVFNTTLYTCCLLNSFKLLINSALTTELITYLALMSNAGFADQTNTQGEDPIQRLMETTRRRIRIAPR